MNYKVIAESSYKNKLLLKPLVTERTIGINNFFMSHEYDPVKMSKIIGFDELRGALKNGEPYRFMHTEYMLQSFYVLGGFLDERTHQENYDFFIQGRNKPNEQYISFEKFLELREFTRGIARDANEIQFLAYILATHDIGCVKGEARHFIRSGEMSVNIFKSLGYGGDFCEMAKIINGNHSLLGDILIGEGTPDYAIKAYDQLERLSLKMGKAPDYGWKVLYVLNALDMHAAYGGFLTENKIQELIGVKDRDALIALVNSWGVTRQEMLGIINPGNDEDIDHSSFSIFLSKVSQFFRKHHPHITLIPDVNNLYMQYCYDRIKGMNKTDACIFLNKLASADHLIKQLTENKHFCITFKSGKAHNMEVMQKFISNDFFVECESVEDIGLISHDGLKILFKGQISGLTFEITNDGYLEIDDVSTQN